MTDLLDRIRELDPAAGDDLPDLSFGEVLRAAVHGAEPTRTRRPTVTLAAVAAAMVLVILGLAIQWRGQRGTATSTRVVAIVFLVPDATPDVVDQVGQGLVRLGFDVRYRDKQAALEEFRRLFPESPELTERLATDPSTLPTSYDLLGRSTDGRSIEDVLSDVTRWPGVFSAQVVGNRPAPAVTVPPTPVETSRTGG